MPTSRERRAAGGVSQQIRDLCWGAWVELGVSGWGRTHQNWAIDPEPLIIFTASVGHADPRLRDEATDWCIRNWRYVSGTRLRNILRLQPDDEAWGVFSATVNARAGVHWPAATNEHRAYRVTSRSTVRPLSEPSLVFLRMRAMFGVGARTEILRFFLLNPGSRVTAAALAEATNHAKRNIAEACDLLVQADVLSQRTVGNRFYFSLLNARAITTFVGATPSIAPDWNALLRVVGTIDTLSDRAREVSADVLVVEVHQAALEIGDDLDRLGIQGPHRIRGAAFLDVWNQWAAEVMTDIASGEWPWSEESEDRSPVVALRPSGRTRRTPVRSR
jgi:hypothetical protein